MPRRRKTEEEKATALLCRRCKKSPWVSHWGEPLCATCLHPSMTQQEPTTPPACHWLDDNDDVEINQKPT